MHCPPSPDQVNRDAMPTPVRPVTPPAATEPVIPAAGRPPLARSSKDAWVGGVASGIARHLGWPLWIVRAIFFALFFTNFLGVVVYAALWVLMSQEQARPDAPGLEAAARAGMRPAGAKPPKSANAGLITAVVALGIGIVLLVQTIGLGVSGALFWPLTLAGLGVALVWKQADRPETPSDAPAWLAPFVSGSKTLSIMRMVVGMGLVGLAVSLIAASQIGPNQLPAVLTMTALVLAGVAIMAAPWIHRAQRNLIQAREEKLLADARADMAAHLHDSVLQTLALIQRQADDPRSVASLARRQERELRTWLYGETDSATSLKAALAEASASVEDERGIAIETVCVGDLDMTDSLAVMVSAAREAMMNAAKHSGADLVDVYAEVEDDRVEVFIRDRGRGFNMADIADDRMGLRGSIIGRMERHGGKATIRSAPGEGTEVRLEMSR